MCGEHVGWRYDYQQEEGHDDNDNDTGDDNSDNGDINDDGGDAQPGQQDEPLPTFFGLRRDVITL
jgi:hypothetical protein